MKHPLAAYFFQGHWRMERKFSAMILCLLAASIPLTGAVGERLSSKDKAPRLGTRESGIARTGRRMKHATAIQCFSCMSRTMGSLWEAAELDKIYMQQQSFTDHCHKPDEHRPATFFRQCSTTCISMLIEVQFGMGARTQLRGCYDSIFRSGFNESSPSALRLRHKDFCQRFNLSDIIKQRLKYDSVVEICSCRGNFCNGGLMPTSAAPSAAISSTISVFYVSIMMVLLWWGRLLG